MRFTLGLKCVVNSSHLVKPLDWLNCSVAYEGKSFVKDPLGSGSSFFGALPQCRHPVHLSSRVNNGLGRVSNFPIPNEK